MAGRRIDIRELVRHLRANDSDRAVQRDTGIDRRTVQRYRAWAAEQALLTGPLPALEELQRLLQQTLAAPAPPQMVSSVEPFRSQVIELRAQATEMAAIWERLKERGYTGSYSSIRRFVRTLEPKQPEAYGRVETAPGEEAQVDFGYAGRMLDPQTGQLRKAWAFVMVLAASRHQYVEFVWDQTIATWLMLHRHAFEFFGGVPTRIVLDNLKAAITKACWDPTLITQANTDVLAWCQTTAGLRTHGTTKAQPLRQFEQIERARLHPLPRAPYDVALWKRATVHRDCSVVFEQAFYSVPFRLIGQHVQVRGGSREVRIYTADSQLVATHPRAQQAGERLTHPDHLPPEKLPGLLLEEGQCRATAADIGPATRNVVEAILGDGVIDRRRTGLRLLHLREPYGDERLERACERALRCEEASYPTVKRILHQELDQAEPPPAAPSAPARTCVRSAGEVLGHLFGGGAWT